MSQHEHHASAKAGAKDLPVLPMSELEREADLYADRMLKGDSSDSEKAFRHFSEENPARVAAARTAYRDSFRAVMAGHYLIVPDDEVDDAREAMRVGAL